MRHTWWLPTVLVGEKHKLRFVFLPSLDDDFVAISEMVLVHIINDNDEVKIPEENESENIIRTMKNEWRKVKPWWWLKV